LKTLRTSPLNQAALANNIELGMEPQSFSPKAVDDIQAWVLYERLGEDLYCVGSLERDKYIAVPANKVPLVMNFVTMLDGNHPLETIGAKLEAAYGQKTDVIHLYELFSSANLIETPKPAKIFQGEFRRFSVDLFSLNTRRFFKALRSPAMRSLKPLFFLSLAVIILGSFSLNPQFISNQNIFMVGESFLLGYVVLAVGSLFSILCHELAHAYVAAAYGAVARKVRMALYMGFIPYFYTEIAGIYTLKPALRIRIWLAGSYVNLLLGSLGLLAYRWLGPGMPLEVVQIITKFSLANFFMILGNLSPLMPTDGYFIISTLLKQANIRTNALFEFLKWVRGEKHRLRGWVFGYFMLTSTIILAWLGMQLYWLIGIADEILKGHLGIATFQTQIYFLIFIGVALARLLGMLFVKWVKLHHSQGGVDTCSPR